MRSTELARYARDIAHRIVRGEPYATDLVEGIARLFDTDAGTGLNCIDLTAGGRWVATTTEASLFTVGRLERAREVVPQHPCVRGFAAVGVRQALRVTDITPLRKFWGTDVYEAVHGPEGGRYPGGAALLKTARSVLFLGVQRRSRDFSDAEVGELSRVQALFHHALALRHALDGMVAGTAVEATTDAAVAAPAYRPTVREADVLSLMSRGWTNPRIARGLGITERTVRKHLSAVYEKAGTSGRADTAAWWQRQRGPA